MQFPSNNLLNKQCREPEVDPCDLETHPVDTDVTYKHPWDVAGCENPLFPHKRVNASAFSRVMHLPAVDARH